MKILFLLILALSSSALADLSSAGFVLDPSGNLIDARSRTWSLGASTDFATVVQGSPSTTSNAWPIKITDGTDTAEVKPANTSATASDPALVVAVSPGTPISTKTPLTANSPTVATVGVASAQILASNTSRKGLHIFNNSVNIVYLGFGSTAVIGSGDVLYPGGIKNMDEFDMSTAAVNAIATAVNSSVSIQEYQ